MGSFTINLEQVLLVSCYLEAEDCFGPVHIFVTYFMFF